jgi:uncharacterized membrane protein YhhN
MSAALWTGLAFLAGAGTLAIAGAELKRVTWVRIGKPVATASLLLVVGGAEGAFSSLIAAGLLLSLAGDVALIGDADESFVLGAGIFFVAHLCYAAAFLGVAGSPLGFVAGAPAVLASVGLVRALWRGLGQLRWLVIAYTTVLSATVVCGFGTLGGPLPGAASLAACVGLCLFYASDALLAWNRFRKPVPHAPLYTMGVYWLGQLGIALAARLAP